MKAVYIENYCDIEGVIVKDLEIPTPKKGQVLVKNKASSINFGNVAHIKGKPLFIKMATGLKTPKFHIIGGDVSGVVISVGEGVTDFTKGDEVMGDVSDTGFGAWAEYVLVKEKNLVKKPENISFIEAGCLPLGAGVAYEALIKKGSVKNGMEVLIVGATGSIGIYAIQIAKSVGANVVAVCASEKGEEIRKVGADEMIDYKSTDLGTIEKRFDIILGIAGSTPLKVYKRLLKDNGVLVNIGGDMKQFRRAFTTGMLQFLFSSKKLSQMMYLSNKATLSEVALLAEQGVIKPYVDKTFKLENITDALKFYESKQAIGKIAVEIG